MRRINVGLQCRLWCYQPFGVHACLPSSPICSAQPRSYISTARRRKLNRTWTVRGEQQRRSLLASRARALDQEAATLMARCLEKNAHNEGGMHFLQRIRCINYSALSQRVSSKRLPAGSRRCLHRAPASLHLGHDATDISPFCNLRHGTEIIVCIPEALIIQGRLVIACRR